MIKNLQHSSIKQYSVGFIFSLILTALAFMAVTWDYSPNTIIFLLIIFAVAQLIVQLVFFLHINKEQNPRWNLMMFLLATWFVLAIVVGSIWIMANLNYNMDPDEVDKQLIEGEGIEL